MSFSLLMQDWKAVRQRQRRLRRLANELKAERLALGPTWREVSRICLPGWFIGRKIRRLADLICYIGPDLEQFLEPWHERLCDMASPSLYQRLCRDTLRWLLEEPNSAPETTLEEIEDQESSKATDDPEKAPEIKSSERDERGPHA